MDVWKEERMCGRKQGCTEAERRRCENSGEEEGNRLKENKKRVKRVND